MGESCINWNKSDIYKDAFTNHFNQKESTANTNRNSNTFKPKYYSYDLCYGSLEPLKITNVVFNNPATIVFWSDKTKTIVKCENEAFDEEKGLAMAISKKFLGNKGNYYNEFKKWLPGKDWSDLIADKEIDLSLVTLDEAIKRTNENLKKITNTFKSSKGEK